MSDIIPFEIVLAAIFKHSPGQSWQAAQFAQEHFFSQGSSRSGHQDLHFSLAVVTNDVVGVVVTNDVVDAIFPNVGF